MKKKEIIKRLEALEAIVNPKPVLESESKPTFKPVFMKYTQEQFNRMRPKLESVGCRIFYVDIHDDRILTNNYRNTNNTIATVGEKNSKIHNRTEVHTESEFLEACGYVEEKIEYTLENIQVDLSYVSDEQLENIKNILINNGYKVFDIWKNSKNNILRKSEFGCNVFSTYCLSSNFNTITYEKFMELFSEKPIEAKREPKVGDVVKAWECDDDIDFTYGVFQENDGTDHKPYKVSGNWFDNIELVTEININDFKREEN